MLRYSCVRMLVDIHSHNPKVVPRVNHRSLLPVPRFTEFQYPGPLPLAFTIARPAPLEDVDLDEIEIDPEFLKTASRAELAHLPVVRINAERMGLNERLINFISKKGIERFTPVQARLLQRMYAMNDAAVCSPTGSGKTFGLCLALVARLMRVGPSPLMNTIFLSPSNELCWQIEDWIREMWWHPNDDHLVFSATSDLVPSFVNEKLRGMTINDDLLNENPPPAPHIVVGVPSVLHRYYEFRMAERLQGIPTRELQKRETGRTMNKMPAFPFLDTFICDEVDVVLPPRDKNAPGNILLRELYGQFRWQAPLHVVMTSATLAPSILRHVRKFMRGSVFESTSSRIFEGEEQAHEAILAEQQLDDIPRVRCVPTLSHFFYSANSKEEYIVALREAMKKTHFDVSGGSSCGLLVLPPSASEEQFVDDVVKKNVPSAVVSWKGSAPCERKPNFVVCRQGAIRGIDMHHLSHVFIFARPETPLEYVHWAGRVGRMGEPGYSVVIMDRSFIRRMSQICETIGVRFVLEKKTKPMVDPYAEARNWSSS